MAKQQINNQLPIKFERDENGLLKHIQYKFTEEGYIDWRAMISSEFLYLNPDLRRREKIEKKYGKSFSEIDISKDKIEDTDLVISLAGLKNLLRLRGYTDINYLIKESNQEYCSVSCSISFLGNYETETKKVDFSDCACAHLNNTTDFGQKYLVEIATNRAFCRAIRNFLNINIVSKEELGKDNQVEENTVTSINNNFNPVELLEKVATSKEYSFEDIKQKMLKNPKNFPGAESYTKFSDIPREQILKVLEKLNKN